MNPETAAKAAFEDLGVPQDCPGLFSLTSWKTVLLARDPQDPEGADALERLMRRYYVPIRRIILLQRRCSTEEADDLTQEFIKECLRRDFLQGVGPEKGRFRTFIRRCLENFLRDERVRARAQKRGGGVAPLPLDSSGSEDDPGFDHASNAPIPGEQLDLAWARHVVESSLSRLEEECNAALRGALFRELRGCLVDSDEFPNAAAVAVAFGMEESSVHVARRRLRIRLGELISEEVRATTCGDADWREELRYLVRLTAGWHHHPKGPAVDSFGAG